MATPAEQMNQLPERTVTLAFAPETTQELTGAERSLMLAKDFVVDSPEMYTVAGSELRDVKTRYRQLDDMRKSLTHPLDVLKRQWMEFFRPAMESLKEAEKIYKKTMLAYDDEQERKRREEEARLREQARKEQERLEKRAELARQKGREEKAEELQQQAESIPTPIVSTPKPTAPGISTRTLWRVRITNKMELIQAVADGKAPSDVLDVNMKVLDKLAVALHENLSYPGVEVYSEKSMASR